MPIILSNLVVLITSMIEEVAPGGGGAVGGGGGGGEFEGLDLVFQELDVVDGLV